jgi:hypothetical protein
MVVLAALEEGKGYIRGQTKQGVHSVKDAFGYLERIVLPFIIIERSQLAKY